MKIRIALFTGLVLTLGTAMSAVAINSGPGTRSADTVATTDTRQVESIEKTPGMKPVASRILVLPRPL